MIPSETIIFCEGYDDRAFWAGFFEANGLSSARNTRDPFGKEVKGGDFGYHTPGGRFVRIRPCNGINKIKPALIARWKRRAPEPLDTIILNFDTDEEADAATTSGLDRALDIVRELEGETGPRTGEWPVYVDGIRIDLVLWSTTASNRAGMPPKQTLERVACAAILDAYPQRGEEVAAWLSTTPALTSKNYSWSHMAKWYAEHGCSDFYKQLWRDEAVSNMLRGQLEEDGYWDSMMRLLQ